jgi:hypothetical protein
VLAILTQRKRVIKGHYGSHVKNHDYTLVMQSIAASF